VAVVAVNHPRATVEVADLEVAVVAVAGTLVLVAATMAAVAHRLFKPVSFARSAARRVTMPADATRGMTPLIQGVHSSKGPPQLQQLAMEWTPIGIWIPVPLITSPVI